METLKKYWPYAAIIILIFLFLHQCSKTKEYKEQGASTYNFLNDSITYYKNGLGSLAATKSSLQGDKNALKILLSSKIDSIGQLKEVVKKFKSVKAAGNITQQTKIDTVKVFFPEPIDYSFSKDFKKVDEHYTLTGQVNSTGVTIYSLNIPNTTSFVIGEKKKGLFSSEIRIDAVNSNPLVKNIGLDSYILKVPVKRFGIGVYVGYGINSNFQIAPSTGISLNYNFLRF